MPKVDYCPACGTELVPTKTTRMRCPRPNCGFQDRRCGNSTIEPLADRREGTNRYLYQENDDPWRAEKRVQK